MNENKPYTPDDVEMKYAYITFESAPSSYFVDYDLTPREEAQERWSRWLAAHDAQVARDALNGYAVHLWSGGSEDATGAKRVMDYTRTHFPEEPTDA